MTEKDVFPMSQRELNRLHIVRKVLERSCKQREAAELLNLSTRQIRRILVRLHQEGDGGIIHKSRGKPSGRRIRPPIRKRILQHFRKHYHDFGPTLASEKLLERHSLKVHPETLRLWLKKDHIPYPERKPRPHRSWRPRKECLGEMVQIDGSHHDWLEGRGLKLCLMAYIDDAASRVFARFYAYEGTLPAMDSLKRYSARYGIPQSLYLDRHTTYKSWAKPTIEEDLADTGPLSQFGRACKQLGLKLIYANSPQAKGRIERQFRTFQDRLVKELRLEGAKTIEDANRVLEAYLPKYNARFQIQALKDTDLHRALSDRLPLESIFSIRDTRVLRNDFTIPYKNKLYQIQENVRTKTLTIEERLDGTLAIRHKDRDLSFHEIKIRPNQKKKEKQSKPNKKPKAHQSPVPWHPWRKFTCFKKPNAA